MARQSFVPQDFGIILLAVLSTCGGCFPLGMIALVYAFRANECLRAGDEKGATSSSQLAMIWAGIAFVCQIVLAVIYALGHQTVYNKH